MRFLVILPLLLFHAACSSTGNGAPQVPELNTYVPQKGEAKVASAKEVSERNRVPTRQKVAVFPGRSVADLQAGIDQVLACWRDDPRFYGLPLSRMPGGFAFGDAQSGLVGRIIRLTEKNLAIALTGPKYSKYLEAEMSLAMRGKPVCEGPGA